MKYISFAKLAVALACLILLTAAVFTYMKTPPDKIAVIKTSMGEIKMKFYPKEAPETVKNFQELAKKGFFNGVTFHRVIPGFMIQGGDPTGTGMGGESYKGPGTTVKGEVSKNLKHVRGAVSMANKGGDPSTASSQFFIVQNKDGTPFLDGGYTIFGQVFEGFEVVDAIAAVERDDSDKPLTPVTMNEVTILEE
jgi:peptidyl-prolyl cis-trans isomerase B (cyclophilin B)